MFTPFDVYTFETCQLRHIEDTRAKVEQIHLAQLSQSAKITPWFKLIRISLATLFFA